MCMWVIASLKYGRVPPTRCYADSATLSAMGGFVSLERSLLAPPHAVRASFAFQPISGAVLADAEAQRAVLAALLHRCLPCLAASASEAAFVTYGSAQYGMLCSLPLAVGAASLQPALRSALRQPGGSAPIQQALRLIPALPLHRGTGLGAELFGEQHVAAALLLDLLCQPASAAAAETAAEWRVACWTLLQALPRLAASFSSLGDGERALALCHPLGLAAAKLMQHFNSIANHAELACWAAAADAAIRLVPTVVRLHALSASIAARSATAGQSVVVPALAELLLGALLIGGASATVRYWAPLCSSRQPFPAGQAQLPRPMWQLHSRLCKLVHWLACGGSHAALPFASAADGMQRLIAALTIIRSVLLEDENRGCALGVLRCGACFQPPLPASLICSSSRLLGGSLGAGCHPCLVQSFTGTASLLCLQRARGGRRVCSALAGSAGCCPGCRGPCLDRRQHCRHGHYC